jgi:hypothetical protein
MKQFSIKVSAVRRHEEPNRPTILDKQTHNTAETDAQNCGEYVLPLYTNVGLRELRNFKQKGY